MNVRSPGALRAVFTGAIAACVFVVAWLYRFNDPGGSFAYLTDDHWFYLVRGWQILFGELPVRDFVDHGAPLFYYVGAAVQVVFGRGTLSEITFCVTVLAGCAAGVFLLGTQASGSRLLGLAAAVWHILLDPRFYNYPKVLVYVAAIPALWAFADRPDRRRVAVIAIVTAVAFLFRHDHGVFVAGAFVVLLAVLSSVSWGQRCRHALLFAALVLTLLAPYLVFIEMNGGIATYLRTAAAWAERDRDRAEVVWPGVGDNPDGVSDEARQGNGLARAVAVVRDNGVAWTFYGELALPVVALLLIWLSPSGFRPQWPNASAKLTMVAVLAVMLNAGFLRSPLAARLADPSVPHAILLAWLPLALGALVWRRDLLRPALSRPIPAAAVRIAGLALAIPLLAILWTTVTHNAYRRLDKASLVDGRRRAVERAEFMREVVGRSFPIADEMTESAETVMALAHYVRQCTPPTDRVFMQHYLPQVLALGERGFAGGHADLRPGFFKSEEMQRLTLARLQRQRVTIALVGAGDTLGGFRESFPLIARYFDEHYRTGGERVFDSRFGVRLLVRNDATPRGTFEPLGWPCFR